MGADSKHRGWKTAALLLGFACAGTTSASASMTVLVGEPYGNFGTMMPNGHTAVYLDRVCADGPLHLRMCREDEPRGVVIARYHALGTLDWIASPVLEFVYAAERPEDVAAATTKESVWEARQRYRAKYLLGIVPDGRERDKATEEWVETAGAAFDRRVWGYRLATTTEQDERLVAWMNARENLHAYRLRHSNCADFAADVVNFYFPGAVRRDRVADLGIMSPKQVARSVEQLGEAHPELAFRVLEVPQIPGTLRRSRPVRGGAEALLKTKRYVATLLVIQPEVPVVLETMYLAHGRWQIGRDASVISPYDFSSHPPPDSAPASASTGSAGELQQDRGVSR